MLISFLLTSEVHTHCHSTLASKAIEILLFLFLFPSAIVHRFVNINTHALLFLKKYSPETEISFDVMRAPEQVDHYF